MSNQPEIHFAIGDAAPSVRPDEGVWSAPLPQNRSGISANGPGDGVQCGDYLTAVGEFISRDGFRMLSAAASRLTRADLTPGDLDSIIVRLVKHGAFYHPVKLEVSAGKHVAHLVVNGAVSDVGREGIGQEYRNLQRLASVAGRWIPEVFGRGECTTPAGHPVSLFLAEWIEGFCEFHLTGDSGAIVVWDPERGNYHLTGDVLKRVYAEAARILTLCYDIETFEQVFPWHHASGDFVVRHRDGLPEVRLITVRGYVALIDNPDRDEAIVLQALLVFLLNLSIRMRLDRLDGTGSVAWAGPFVLEAVVCGFFRGLAQKSDSRWIDRPLVDAFREHILDWSPTELLELAAPLAEAFPVQQADLPVIRDHLESHVHELHRLLIA